MATGRLIVVAAALALLGALTSAQGRVHRGHVKGMRSATLDLATGTITRRAAVEDRSTNTVEDFSNGDFGGFAVDTGGGSCEWFTVGVKGYNGNQSDLMASFRFGYCSTALDVLSGGPGGSVKLGFYEGYALGGPAPTPAQTVAVLTLTGLPANTVVNCWPFGHCWTMTVTFGTEVCFADGAIAYSWKFLDAGCFNLGNTYPTLGCVRSCDVNPLSGPYPGGAAAPDGQGMTDFIDRYCPPGTLLSTRTFNSVPGTTPMFTSQTMRIRECADVTATVASFNSTSPPNTDLFSAMRVVLGTTWTATTTRVGGTGGVYSIRINDAKSPLANGVKCSSISLPSATGRNLLGGNSLATFTGPIVGATGVHTAAIPCDPSLLGFYWAGQSLVASGLTVRRCTSAVEGTIGSL